MALAFKDKSSYKRAMEDFRAIIVKWPDLDALAADAGAGKEAVKKWKRRNTIPAEYWAGLIQAAETRGIQGVTADVLATIARRLKAA